MIHEETKDLIYKDELLQELMVRTHLREDLGSGINNRISAAEIIQTIYDFPTVQDYGAIWLRDEKNCTSQCSWCKTSALYNSENEPALSKFCPNCGRRMRG